MKSYLLEVYLGFNQTLSIYLGNLEKVFLGYKNRKYGLPASLRSISEDACDGTLHIPQHSHYTCLKQDLFYVVSSCV